MASTRSGGWPPGWSPAASRSALASAAVATAVRAASALAARRLDVRAVSAASTRGRSMTASASWPPSCGARLRASATALDFPGRFSMQRVGSETLGAPGNGRERVIIIAAYVLLVVCGRAGLPCLAGRQIATGLHNQGRGGAVVRTQQGCSGQPGHTATGVDRSLEAAPPLPPTPRIEAPSGAPIQKQKLGREMSHVGRDRQLDSKRGGHVGLHGIAGPAAVGHDLGLIHAPPPRRP